VTPCEVPDCTGNAWRFGLCTVHYLQARDNVLRRAEEIMLAEQSGPDLKERMRRSWLKPKAS